MHKYLRAIGFSAIQKPSDLEALLQNVIGSYDSKDVVMTKENRPFAEFTREFAPDCALRVCGEYDENGNFTEEYHFPFLYGSQVSSSESAVIERESDKESYIGACDDMRLDFSLIFHLINTVDYLKRCREDAREPGGSAVMLSALSVEGKILLPILRTEAYVQERQKKFQKRSAKIIAARNGDENAMEDLTMEDMDIYNEISRRVQNEDVYSIVDNCFMPYGFGSDIYSVIGDIIDFKKEENSLTKEQLYKLNLVCNGMSLDVCINEKDLMGEPAVGRRFKGVIWLQGVVTF